MDPSQRVDYVFAGDPVLTVVFFGLLFVLVIFLLEAGMRK